MKVLIICGHGQDGSNYDPGASGCGLVEATETIRYGNKIAKYLRAYCDVDVYEGNMYHRLFKRGVSFNFKEYDYVLECHVNSYKDPNANGAECFVTTMEKYITVETKIMKGLSKYFKLRDNDAVFDGVKRYNFGVIHHIKSKYGVSSALLELGFISNQSNMTTYQTNIEEICKAIAVNIAEGHGLTDKKPPVVEVPEDAPIAKPEHDKYKVGDLVNVEKIYSSANGTVGKKPYFKTSKITEILPGKLHPYKLVNGGEVSGFSDLEGLNGVVQSTPQYRTHKLTSTDTLWSLAVKYLGSGSRWTEIQALNPGINPKSLKVGSTINIPNK